MKKIHNKWLKGGLLGLLAIFGMASCSDDHFDLNSTNATSNLWQNIVATNQVDSFAEILEKTIVNKKSYGIPATITYKDLLSSSRVFTVWAPKDGTYNAKKWLKLLEEGDNETVEKQFIRNHIANFNYSGAYATSEQIRMYNRKYAVYDVPNNTLKGISISSDSRYKNIASVNGTVHVLEGAVPYLPTLRETLQGNESVSDINNYIASEDTLIFIEAYSTPGSTVNGEVQYVDSYFVESNKVIPYISMTEDSLSAAIYPSNTAWNEALNKISKFYNYKEKNAYYDKDASVWRVDSINPDSLKLVRTVDQIFSNMFYSLHEQPGFDVTKASPESVQNFFNTTDSLVSTTYYHSNYQYHQHSASSKFGGNCNELAEGKLPSEASNGYAFITDHYNFIANKSWQFDLLQESEWGFDLNTEKCKYVSTANPTGIYHAITDGNRNDSVKGTVHALGYREFQPTNEAAKQTLAFNLYSVLSGTYDIYVVIVPENMTDKSNLTPKKNKFTATLEYDYDENGNAKTIASPDAFETDPTKVDTVLLFENFKFPYCFSGLSYSKPVLSLTVVRSVSEKRTVTTTMNIDCIVLKGKDE